MVPALIASGIAAGKTIVGTSTAVNIVGGVAKKVGGVFSGIAKGIGGLFGGGGSSVDPKEDFIRNYTPEKYGQPSWLNKENARFVYDANAESAARGWGAAGTQLIFVMLLNNVELPYYFINNPYAAEVACERATAKGMSGDIATIEREFFKYNFGHDWPNVEVLSAEVMYNAGNEMMRRQRNGTTMWNDETLTHIYATLQFNREFPIEFFPKVEYIVSGFLYTLGNISADPTLAQEIEGYKIVSGEANSEMVFESSAKIGYVAPPKSQNDVINAETQQAQSYWSKADNILDTIFAPIKDKISEISNKSILEQAITFFNPKSEILASENTKQAASSTENMETQKSNYTKYFLFAGAGLAIFIFYIFLKRR